MKDISVMTISSCEEGRTGRSRGPAGPGTAESPARVGRAGSSAEGADGALELLAQLVEATCLGTVLGGNGILLENHIVRHLADMEALHTYEGTAEIQTLVVGRDVTGVSAFT